jgi:hypothetical protein
MLTLPVALPSQYRLDATVTRIADVGSFEIILPFGGASPMITFDGWTTSHVSGLSSLGGKSAYMNPTRSDKFRFIRDHPAQLSVIRMHDRLVALADGQPILDWSGPPSAISTLLVPTSARILLSSYDSEHRISRLTLTPLTYAPPAATVAQTAAEPMPAPAPAQQAQWVDQLAAVDLAQAIVAGRWQRTPEGIQVESGRQCRMALPASPAGSYDLKVKFKRLEGAMVGIHLPIEGRAILLSAGQLIGGKTTLSLGNIDGKSPYIQGNPTRTVIPPIVNQVEHELLASVIRSETEVRIVVLLDDKPVIDWKGPLESLATYRDFAPRDPARLGLAANGAKAVFLECLLRSASAD